MQSSTAHWQACKFFIAALSSTIIHLTRINHNHCPCTVDVAPDSGWSFLKGDDHGLLRQASDGRSRDYVERTAVRTFCARGDRWILLFAQRCARRPGQPAHPHRCSGLYDEGLPVQRNIYADAGEKITARSKVCGAGPSVAKRCAMA